jgi:O-antigen/teichoic acid export membrane protein
VHGEAASSAAPPAPPVPDEAPPSDAERTDASVPVGGVRRFLRFGRVGSVGTGATLVRGSVVAFVARAGSMVMSFVVQALLARRLGVVEYGVYAYAVAFSTVLLILAKAELDTVAMRYVPTYVGVGRWSLLRGFLRTVSRLTLGLSIGVSLVAALVLGLLPERWAGGMPHSTVWAMCALLPPSAILLVQSGYLQALKHTIAAQVPVQLGRSVLTVGGVVAVFALGAPRTATSALLINIGATLAMLAVTHRLYRARIPEQVRAVPAQDELGTWLRSARGLALISAAQLVLGTQTDVLVVGSFLGPADAARYGTASNLAGLVGFGMVALLSITLPYMSEYHATGRREQLQRLLSALLWANAVVTLPVALGAILLGPWVLGIFGEAFVAAYPTLIVLVVSATIISAIGGTAGFAMGMTGNENAAAVIIIISAVLNLGLSLVFTPRFGILGTASATLVSVVVRAALLTGYLARREIRVLDFGSFSPFHLRAALAGLRRPG